MTPGRIPSLKIRIWAAPFLDPFGICTVLKTRQSFTYFPTSLFPSTPENLQNPQELHRPFGTSNAKIHSLKYGDVEVTSEKVVKLFEKCITEYTAIRIDNDTFANDPKPNVKKYCEIDYTFNNFRRRRGQEEGRIMNFEWEITDIEYGRNEQTWHKDVYYGKPDTVTALYRWLDQDGKFTVSNENLGGDPAKGVHKKVGITYIRVKRGGADYWQDINGYDRYFISESEGKETAFKEYFGFIDKTMTITDPWKWAKKGLGVIPGVGGGKVSDNSNVISWLVNNVKREFFD